MRTSLAFLALLFGTLPSKKQNSFAWVTWDKVTTKVKTELKNIKADKTTTVYNSILAYKKEGVLDTEISVAVLDMDKDGKPEYALAIQSKDYCGDHGCSLDVYKDGGKLQVQLVDEIESVTPAKNGVISSQGVLMKFKTVKI